VIHEIDSSADVTIVSGVHFSAQQRVKVERKSAVSEELKK
jgi:hypothetical protein